MLTPTLLPWVQGIMALDPNLAAHEEHLRYRSVRIGPACCHVNVTMRCIARTPPSPPSLCTCLHRRWQQYKVTKASIEQYEGSLADFAKG